MTTAGHQVFISYCSQESVSNTSDKRIADMIYTELESRNIRCWIAHRNILPGEEWLNPIFDAIEISKVIVVVFSANTEGSDWVQDEIKYALDKKIKIIPFRIENVEPKGTLRILKVRCQWLDAFTSPLEEHLNRLADVVSQHLGLIPGMPVNPVEKTISDLIIEDGVEKKIEPGAQPIDVGGRHPDLAGQIAVEMGGKHESKNEERFELAPEPLITAPNIYRNPFEDNVEYIKIPGGTYKFSVTKKMETVPDLYFCKYPVTNKRYRKFISYLAGKERSLEEILPLKVFPEKLFELADTIKDYHGYLATKPGEWWSLFRSNLDDNIRFNGDDQPVVRATWYAAHAYCFWLSCLQQQKELYRLPTEKEWEWAAAGREPGGALRTYPWIASKGKPSPDLANYGGNVGVTTPVGRYPKGATPEGLMDMAGNVWEWMDNRYDEKNGRALRGGSWDNQSDYLRSAVRFSCNPWHGLFDGGFRVVRVSFPSQRGENKMMNDE